MFNAIVLQIVNNEFLASLYYQSSLQSATLKQVN